MFFKVQNLQKTKKMKKIILSFKSDIKKKNNRTSNSFYFIKECVMNNKILK